MRRLLRILFAIALVICLLLAIGTATLWVRSKFLFCDGLVHYRFDPIKRSDSQVSFVSLDGALALYWLTRDRSVTMPMSPEQVPDGLYLTTQRYSRSAISYKSLWTWLGFRLRWPVASQFEFGLVAVPHWF